MTIKYNFFLNPGAKRKRFHPRVVGSHTLSTEKMLEHMKDHGTNVASMQYALYQLERYLTEALSEGNSVHINGIGTFSLILTAPETRDPSQRHAQSISVKSIDFRPEKALLKNISGRATFERSTQHQSGHNFSLDNARQVLTDYFRTHEYITIREFTRCQLLTRHTASARLKALCEEGFLENIGDRTRALYRLKG